MNLEMFFFFFLEILSLMTIFRCLLWKIKKGVGQNGVVTEV